MAANAHRRADAERARGRSPSALQPLNVVIDASATTAVCLAAAGFDL
jgi:hypothetical protein